MKQSPVFGHFLWKCRLFALLGLSLPVFYKAAKEKELAKRKGENEGDQT